MISYIKYFLAFAMSLLLIASCELSENISEIETQQGGKHVSKMVFRGAVSGYEGSQVRSTGTKGTTSWTEGDIVYIAFFNGETIIPGTAVYSEADGWSVMYEGDLAEGSSQKCEVRFFVNTTFANENLVTLNANTEIYEDMAGSFDYADGTLTVSASLAPKVGRIRFTGNANDQIHVTGITTYTTFSPAGNRFSTTSAMIPLTVENTGSTPYIYGYFTYDDRKLGIVGSDFAFTRTCSSSVFQTGDSGYMKIPSSSSHQNWKTGLIVTVKGVDFKMLPVVGYSGGFFLLAETETTNAQYYAVTGENGTSNNFPHITDYTYRDNSWTKYITKINYATSLKFYIPSKEEWQYAASGGSLSQGYTYSGSNTPGDVAWYAGNSGNSMQEVKQLSPNELGFYDMSGNVWEWTSNLKNNGYYFICGGSYAVPENNVQVSSTSEARSDSGVSSYSHGLRLALKCQ